MQVPLLGPMVGDVSRSPHLDSDLVRALSAAEPDELRTFLTVPEPGRALHFGTTAPMLGVHRESAFGLAVPVAAQEAASPFDYAGVFLTFENLAGTKSTFESIPAALSRYDRAEMLGAIGTILQRLHGGDEWTTTAPRTAAGYFNERLSASCHSLLDQDRKLFTPNGAMVLAKLALVHGGTATDADAPPLEHMLTLLFTKVHDHLGRMPPGPAGDTVRVDGELTPVAAYLTANQIFNRNFDEASFLQFYQQRWNNPSRVAAMQVKDKFRRTMGFGVDDQADLALAIWAGARANGHVFHSRSALESAGFEPGVLDKMLTRLSRPLADVRDAIAAKEIGELDLEWNFDTMEQYPLIEMENGTYLALEPAHLVRRCMGWSPIYDLNQRKRDEHSMAMTSEACAFEVLESVYEPRSPLLSRRLFNEAELKALAPTARGADAAVDFGSSFAVIEITARRVPRAVVHGKSTAALDELFEMVLDELEQVAGTATALQSERHQLTGVPAAGGVRVYPIVLMVEGFPTNPITLSEIRATARNRGIFEGMPIAPIEIIDLVELDMVEAVTEAGGPSLPELLDAKENSNFRYDSLRNYLHSRADLDLRISKRVNDGVSGPFERLIERLQTLEAGRAAWDQQR